jgi:hypothetical protein
MAAVISILIAVSLIESSRLLGEKQAMPGLTWIKPVALDPHQRPGVAGG